MKRLRVSSELFLCGPLRSGRRSRFVVNDGVLAADDGTKLNACACRAMTVARPGTRRRKGKVTACRSQRGLRHFIEGLGPYQSLLLLAVPVSLVEPLKLIGVAIAGAGHWITGTVAVICAY